MTKSGELKPQIVYFIGAGPGDPELITIKGKRLIEEADVMIYAGSLINPEILKYAKKGAVLYNSAEMDLDQIVSIMIKGAGEGKRVARLHSGDPAIYGAIGEQMELLDKEGIRYDIVPGVSSIFAAASALKSELTLPDVSQTVILTRAEGKTKVPEKESIASLSSHGATMVIFLSVDKMADLVADLLQGYDSQTPVAVVERASWPNQRIIRGTLQDIAIKVKKAGIKRTALVIVGDILKKKGMRSKLYAKDFEHSFRKRLA